MTLRVGIDTGRHLHRPARSRRRDGAATTPEGALDARRRRSRPSLTAFEQPRSPLAAVDLLVLGTTVGHERPDRASGLKVAYLTTAGFKDVPPSSSVATAATSTTSHWIKPNPFLERWHVLAVAPSASTMPGRVVVVARARRRWIAMAGELAAGSRKRASKHCHAAFCTPRRSRARVASLRSAEGGAAGSPDVAVAPGRPGVARVRARSLDDRRRLPEAEPEQIRDGARAQPGRTRLRWSQHAAAVQRRDSARVRGCGGSARSDPVRPRRRSDRREPFRPWRVG